MNPLVLFVPSLRASTAAFVLGLILLAVLDYFRITLLDGSVALLGMALVWYVTFCLFANRRRHASRGMGLAFLPVILAIVVKGIGSAVGFGLGSWNLMLEFAEENGIDTSDMQEFSESVNDPGFQSGFEEWMVSNPEAAETMLAAAALPSYIAFWAVIALFAVWFATMRSAGGTVDTAATAQTPLYPPAAEETPAEEAPAEDTPAEDTPAEEAPAEDTPAEDTPAEEVPTEEAPAEDAPAEDASASDSEDEKKPEA
ncbi:hypothetical protein RMQ97_08800 [Maricaulis sp. D1M11]|uniref:hypothetical protein n=1 Tax=Maricaulis sp. D1M11 TaxID=3076117 RepID=UPI0039B46797